MGRYTLYTCPSSSLSTTIVVLTTIEVIAMYNIMSSCFFGGVSTGEEVRYALRLSKAFLASSVYSNLSVFFNILKKGNPFLPSREIKQLSAALNPVNFCTPLMLHGGPISVMVQIFLELALIPR
jgi:hypothetical protein